jgi:hypothetical protein
MRLASGKVMLAITQRNQALSVWAQINENRPKVEAKSA